MESPSTLLEDVCSERESVDTETLEQIVTLAVELAHEGREGRKVGTIFTVGDADAVRATSTPMILDPLAGHDAALVAEIIPELWILSRYSSHIEAPILTRNDEQVTVMSRVE